MKAAIYAAGMLICSAGIVLADASLAHGPPARAPRPRPPEMRADWPAPPPNAPVGASAPRGNLRGDIENNARWNEDATHRRSPPRR